MNSDAGEAHQLVLGVVPRAGGSFGNFESGGNAVALHSVRAMTEGQGDDVAYLWGAGGTGKTHLLEAAAREAASRDRPAAYLSLRERGELEVSILSGLDQLSLICIDDLDGLVGDAVWEEAFFHLCNRIRANRARLVVTASRSPIEIGFRLADLASRLRAGVVLQLRALDEAGCARALQRRAQERGFELSDDVTGYLLRRERRDMHSLFELFERIDRSSLRHKRRVTVPFVRDLLGLGMD